MRVAENERVIAHVGLHGLFVKVMLTPVGRPEAENVTVALVPLMNVVLIDDDGLVDPWTTAKLPGNGVERLKSKAGGVTVEESFQVSPKPPIVPRWPPKRTM